MKQMDHKTQISTNTDFPANQEVAIENPKIISEKEEFSDIQKILQQISADPNLEIKTHNHDKAEYTLFIKALRESAISNKSIDISSDPLAKVLYNLCLEIEKLPASEQQTKCASMASDALLLFSLSKS